jgi:PTH1 family peptidyl-tRNA hydrolase
MAWVTFFKRLFLGETRPEAADLLFVGLGNIGENYAATRHNIGFMVAEALASRFEKRKNGCFGRADYTYGALFNSKKVMSVKPRTFMNRSGDAVAQYLEALNCPLSNMLVIVDDYHLSLGGMRARRNGSDGGHHGLASIIEKVGDGFPRLRIGIGPLPQECPSVEFVLGAFSPAERESLKTVIPRAVDACLCFAGKGIDEMMNRFNK